MIILLATIAINLFSVKRSLRIEGYLYRRKNLFIRYLKHQINRDTLIERLKIIKLGNPSKVFNFFINTLEGIGLG